MISPQRRALERSQNIAVSEERGPWLKGRFRDGPSFELSFEGWTTIPARLLPAPKVPLVYFGLVHGRDTLAEFFFGKWTFQPRDLDSQHRTAVVFTLLRGTIPMAVADPYQPNLFAPGVPLPLRSPPGRPAQADPQ